MKRLNPIVRFAIVFVILAATIAGVAYAFSTLVWKQPFTFDPVFMIAFPAMGAILESMFHADRNE